MQTLHTCSVRDSGIHTTLKFRLREYDMIHLSSNLLRNCPSRWGRPQPWPPLEDAALGPVSELTPLFSHAKFTDS